MSSVSVNKSLHKWLSLIVSIQLIIWLATGLYFNLMDHDKAGGNALRERVNHHGSFSDLQISPPSVLPQTKAKAVKLIWILGEPYYQVVHEAAPHRYQSKQISLFHAVSGEPAAIDENMAQQIAQRSYSGSEQALTPEFLTPPISELPKEQNPVWSVEFADERNTTVYIDPTNGRVIAHINDDRRLRDLMFKLHFMDYGNSGGFNHPLIIIFAICTLLLAVTGVVWLINLFREGQLRVSLSKQQKSISITHSQSGTSSDAFLSANNTVLEGLSEINIVLPSACGGGGTCGKCQFISANPLPVTQADRQHLSESQIKLGYRLGCQHRVSSVDEIHIDDGITARTWELEVARSRFITPFIKEIAFKVKGGGNLSFRAGAYMKFHIPPATNPLVPADLPGEFSHHWRDYENGEFQHEGAVRHYSLSNYDADTEELVFNVRWQTAGDGTPRAGVGSVYLCNLCQGDVITASGPFSEFYASTDANRKRVFVGCGSGIAPLRSIILETLNTSAGKQPVTFIYGARTQSDLAYRSEFEQLANQHSDFTYIPVLSRPDEWWTGKCGYVQVVLKTYLQHTGELSDTEFYLCGPGAMMAEVETMLIRYNVPCSHIFKDSFNV